MKKPNDDLKFESGRTIGNCRKDAKRIAKEQNIPLWQALNQIAATNTRFLTWEQAVHNVATSK